jgi:hypothetical protein
MLWRSGEADNGTGQLFEELIISKVDRCIEVGLWNKSEELL